MRSYISAERQSKLDEILAWENKVCSSKSEITAFVDGDSEKTKEWFLYAPSGLMSGTPTNILEGLLMSLYTLSIEQITDGMLKNPDFATVILRAAKSVIAYELCVRGDEETAGTAPKVTTDNLMDELMKIFTFLEGTK